MSCEVNDSQSCSDCVRENGTCMRKVQGGAMTKVKVSKPLRQLIEETDGMTRSVHVTADRLTKIADEIDQEHKRRMWQCEHETRRRICKDMRWAVNELENAYWVRRSMMRDQIREMAGEQDA